MSAKYQRDNRTLIWLNREIDSLMRRMFELLNKGEEEQLIELPLDIFETKDALVVIADLPGVTKGKSTFRNDTIRMAQRPKCGKER